MQDNICSLVERLAKKSKTRELLWQPTPAIPETGEIPLRVAVKAHLLRLSDCQGLQLFHWGRWETLCDDTAMLQPLRDAIWQKPFNDEELTALLDDISRSR